MRTVKQVWDLTGISVRALHYYAGTKRSFVNSYEFADIKNECCPANS